MKTKILSLIILFNLTQPVWADMSMEEAFNFRQKELLIEDHLSDQALLKRVERAKRNIGLRLLGKPIEIPEGQSYEERGIRDEIKDELRLEGRENPYNHEGFSNMFLQVIEEERKNGIEPSVGEFHRWSPETISKHRLNPMLAMSKILAALALGVSYRVMYTGQEEALKAYLLEQKDKSVHFDMFFRQAYVLNQGNVYLALLTMENLLAINWKAPHRDHIPHFKKLTPLLSQYNEGGDIYGSYYHFVGIMLYGYVKGGLAAKLVGMTEALGSKILSRFQSEIQENLANFNGGKIGMLLRKSIKNYPSVKFIPDSKHLNVENYLNHNEDFRDRLPLDSTDNLKLKIYHNRDAYQKLSEVHLINKGESLYDCKLEIFSKPYKKARTTKEIIRGNLVSNKALIISIPNDNRRPSVRILISDCRDSEFTGGIQDKRY